MTLVHNNRFNFVLLLSMLLALVFASYAPAFADAEPGAVYVLSNQTTGNAVLIFNRGADGQLTPAGSVATGGLGMGSGLGSQNAATISEDGQWLFAVNPGSNDVSVFAIGPNSLTLTDRVASSGVRPTSLAFRKGLLYVMNAGDAGNITGFTLSHDGKLSMISGSTRPFSNNGVGAAPGPGQISFSPDGDMLIVTERASNKIDLYNVDSNGVASGPLVQDSSGITPFGFAFADRKTLVVSEAFGGAANASAASSYELSANGLRLISASVPTSQSAACWIVTSKNGKYAYSTNAGSASLSGYAVGNDGTLTLFNSRAGETGSGTGPTDAAVSHNGQYIYALSPRTQSLVTFEMMADGSLRNVSTVTGLPAGVAGIASW